MVEAADPLSHLAERAAIADLTSLAMEELATANVEAADPLSHLAERAPIADLASLATELAEAAATDAVEALAFAAEALEPISEGSNTKLKSAIIISPIHNGSPIPHCGKQQE